MKPCKECGGERELCDECGGAGDPVPEECGTCQRYVARGACYWWGVTSMHQCGDCHAQGEADILAREDAERDGLGCACCGWRAADVAAEAGPEHGAGPVCCWDLIDGAPDGPGSLTVYSSSGYGKTQRGA